MNLYLLVKAELFVDIDMTLVKSILVIKSGRIEILKKYMTNVLSNPNNYHFLMKVPRMKAIFNTLVQHATTECTSGKTCRQIFVIVHK